jgi:2-isopropylmalate synthase
LAYRLKNLGHEFNRNEIDVLYDKFLMLADSMKEVQDENLNKLVIQFKENATA